MAIYHLSAKVFSRGGGDSAVHAAAYRARCALTDERTGLKHDYSRKAGELLFAGIYAPKDAPDWARDRAQLWNHVEAFEKRRDAQLAREFNIALPHELTLDQARYAVQDFVRDNFTRKGLIADVTIHAPDKEGDQRNIHAHIMVVMRKLDGSEFAAKKERSADNGERKAELESLRESWERIGNRHLERHGFEPTLDRRSLLAQGVERDPTVHLGKAATAIERKGQGPSELGGLNREITAENERRVIDLAAERAMRKEAAARGGIDDAIAAVPKVAAKARQRPEAAPSMETAVRTHGAASGPEIGKGAGEIRLAFQLTRTASQLAEALSGRHIRLARVTRDDAAASRQAAEDAKAAGKFVPALTEGEIVAVNGFGAVYQLNPRNTGLSRDQIESRLAVADLSAAPTVTQAQTMMREQSRAAFAEQKRTERLEARIAVAASQAHQFGATVAVDGKGRAASAPEALADRLKSEAERQLRFETRHGAQAFAARLADRGLTLARVSAGDAGAVAVLREQEQQQRAATVSRRTPHHFAKLEAGDLAAVTRNGDVYRVNPEGFGDAGKALFDQLDKSGPLPDVIEARTRHARERDRIARIWQDHQAAQTAAREQAITAQGDMKRVAGSAIREADKTERTTVKAAGKAASIARRGILGLLTGLVKWLDPFPAPPPDPAQQKRDRLAAEQQAARDEIKARREADGEQQRAQQRQQQQDPFLARIGALPPTPPTEEQRRQQEQDRSRGYERER